VRRLIISTGAVAIFASACLSPVGQMREPASPTASEPKIETVDREIKADNPGTISVAVEGPAELVALVNATLNDLHEFWAATYPEVYDAAYEPIARFEPYDFDEGDRPQCGHDPLDGDTANGNAFYCPIDDTISWDNEGLFPGLFEQFGDFAVALVLAHEWGHAIQHRREVTGATVLTELQADCFAGAWVGSLEERASSLAPLSDDLDTEAAGFLIFRDPIGIDAATSGAHGNAFDRLGHFGDGLRQGAMHCAELEEAGVNVTEARFRSNAEFLSGGNLPPEEVVPTLSTTLDVYWSGVGERFGFEWNPFDEVVAIGSVESLACDVAMTTAGGAWCQTDDTVHLEIDAVIVPLYNQFGDFGPGLILARVWALKGVELLGFSSEGNGAALRADCLVGDWAGQMVDGIQLDPENESSLISLSPGDLDEAIQSLLFLGGRDGLSAFERVEAMRVGFFDGTPACLGS
jgi:predicted metalloprotease